MIPYTGHPLIDVGLATLAAFHGKSDPSTLTEKELDQVADFLETHYLQEPMTSFLTVAFPNSGFTQPAFAKNPKKRKAYSEKVLRAYKASVPTLPTKCVFTGLPAVGIALDVKDKLIPGRAYRQHIPLITGEDVINFMPYGDSGLPISGIALLALQALPLGCAKISGKLLAVHSNDPEVMYECARWFLDYNRKGLITARMALQSGEKAKMPEFPRKPGTQVVELLQQIEQLRVNRLGKLGNTGFSVTAYYFSNLGQSPDLHIYHLPMEVVSFLRIVQTPRYRQAWEALVDRGWEIVRSNHPGAIPSYNVLFEDLFRLPEESGRFIRRYFLRYPECHAGRGDPRREYSVRRDVGLISWSLTQLFLQEVMRMDAQRIDCIRTLGERLAEYVASENDRGFFRTILMATRYDQLRSALIRAGLNLVKRGNPPLVDFDSFVRIFEEGPELPHSDWRLARDLVLIRMLECLYQQQWLQAHVDDLPEVEPSETDM